MTPTNCQARQYSDQMICGRCGLQWDVNDPDPPTCKTAGELAMGKMRDTLNKQKSKDRK